MHTLSKPISIAIVDEHPLYLEGLIRELHYAPGHVD